jgi:hypothetical protein
MRMARKKLHHRFMLRPPELGEADNLLLGTHAEGAGHKGWRPSVGGSKGKRKLTAGTAAGAGTSAARVLVVLAVVLALMPCGALAQTGHWSITYSTPTGSLDWCLNNGSVQHSSLPLHHKRVGWQSSTRTAWIQETATQTATLSWVDDQGNPAPNPPPFVSVKIRAHAKWDGAGDIYRGDADDGQGDPKDTKHDRGNGRAVSEGIHLRRYDASRGIVRITNTCTQKGEISSAHSGGVEVEWDFSVAVDNRFVQISPSVGPTYYRVIRNGLPVRVAHTPAADGTMWGDTVAPFPDTETIAISYGGVPSLGWGPSCTYHWYSNRTDYRDAGTWSSRNPFPTLRVRYRNAPAQPGVRDHIHLRLTDHADGATATANYYMRFHAKYEDWQTNEIISHPMPLDQCVPDQHGNCADWNLCLMVESDTPEPVRVTRAIAWTGTITMSGTVGGKRPGPWEILTLSANAGISVGKRVSAGGEPTWTITVLPWTTVGLYAAQLWDELHGTCSKWGAAGYEGDVDWSGVRPEPVPAFGVKQLGRFAPLTVTGIPTAGSIARQARQARPTPVHPIILGRVSSAPLEYFCDAKMSAACGQLLLRKVSEVAAAFDAAYRSHPDDLAVFVGWAQSHPQAVNAEIERVQPLQSWRAKFKLGVLLYYRWAAQERRAGKPIDSSGLERAVGLMSQVWQLQREPLAGLMLLDMAEASGVQDKRPVKWPAQEIREELVHQLAGEKAYRRFVEAGKSGWGGDPPPPSATVAANRRPLQGVLIELWYSLGGRIRIDALKNGKFVLGDWQYRRPENRREMEYIDQWIKALKAAS